MVVLLEQRFSAMQASEMKYRTLADNTRDILYQISPEGLVSYVGPQITRYGFTEDDFIGAKVGKFAHPEDRELP